MRAVLAVAFLSLVGCDPKVDDPISGVAGLHVLSDFGDGHDLISTTPSDDAITDTIERLDWEQGFFQVVLVLPSNQSMEVGGSLDPNHGLSSVYRDPNVGEYLVTKDPPSTVREMIKILVSFNRGDDKWKLMFEYE